MSYSRGTDYNCSGAICYGIDAKDAAFRQVQVLINAALARLGLGSSIAVDGKVGSGTVQAILLLAKQPPFKNSPTLAKIQASPKPETVAICIPELLQVFADPTTAFDTSGSAPAPANTQNAMDQVRLAAQHVQMVRIPAPPVAAPQAPNNVTGVTLPTLPTAVKSHIGWWIAGLAGLAGAGFLLVHLAHRRHDDADVEPPP